jgi:hypothetical protein
LPFFPDIYNEDWLFFVEHAAKGELPCVGHARQLEYEPFSDPQRAVREEFGDLLAEGLYALIGTGERLSRATQSYWETFADARQTLFDEIVEDLRMLGDQRGKSGDELDASCPRTGGAHQSRALCVSFLDAWRDDRLRFQRIATGLSNVGSFADAFDILGLKNWCLENLGTATPPPAARPNQARYRSSIFRARRLDGPAQRPLAVISVAIHVFGHAHLPSATRREPSRQCSLRGQPHCRHSWRPIETARRPAELLSGAPPSPTDPDH